MCTTVLHGGVCHRTSTPHKSGNKITEKKKNKEGRKEGRKSLFGKVYINWWYLQLQ